MARRKPRRSRSQLIIGNVAGSINHSMIAGRDVIINLIWPWKWLIGMLLLAAIIFVTISYGPGLYHLAKYRATENEILILLADFRDESDNVTYDAAGSIEEALRTALTQYDLPDVRLVRIHKTFRRSELENVKSLGKRYNATIFIWGHYDDAGMYPRFTILRSDELITLPESPEDRLVNLVNPPDNFVLYVNRDLPTQMTYFSQFTIGQIFYTKKFFSDALGLFDDAIRSVDATKTETIQESLASLYIARGTIYGAINHDYEKGLQDFNRATEIDPNNPEAYSSRGIANFFSDNYVQAFNDYNKAIELDPEFAQAYHNRGVAYMDSGNPIYALQDYNKAIELDPNFTMAYVSRGNLYDNLGYFIKAIEDYKAAIKTDPKYAMAYVERGTAYRYNGDLTQAYRDYKSAIDLDPELASAYVSRGLTFGRDGKLTQALDDFNRVIELEPDYAPAYYYRGDIKYEQGTFDQAIRDFTKCIKLIEEAKLTRGIELDPNDVAPIYRKRGHAFRNAGNLEQSVFDYEKYLELNPDAPDGEEILGLIKELETDLERLDGQTDDQ